MAEWLSANEALIRLMLSGLWETLQMTLLAALFSQSGELQRASQSLHDFLMH